MDFLVILGWLLGIALMVIGIILAKDTDSVTGAVSYHIEMGNLPSFFDLTSIAVVVGGSVAALMISYPGKAFAKIPKHLKILLLPPKYNPHSYIDQIVEFANEARIKGLLALEEKLAECKDEFMKNSLMLVVDSVDADKVKELLQTELDYLDDRHTRDREFYDKAAGFGPAYGMIGTLIGLINLLKNMEDPSALGSAMAVALVTTFYGTVMANLVFSPISNKLKYHHEQEYLCKMIICEGVQCIQAGENPRFIEEKLTQLLPAEKGKKGKKGGEGDEGGGGDDGGKKKKK